MSLTCFIYSWELLVKNDHPFIIGCKGFTFKNVHSLYI